MILFWNNTYYGQMAENGQIPDDFVPPLPAYYWVINYIVGIFFFFAFLTGVTLNPFVVLFNWSKRKNTINLLFIITAVADNVVCVVIPLFYGVLMVQPRVVFYNYMYEIYIVCVMCTFGCTSQVTTTMLGVVRFIKITNPFYSIKNPYVIGYLFLHVLYMCVQVVFIVLLILGTLPNVNGILNKLVVACFSISALHCFAGSICSGLTVLKLQRTAANQEDKVLVSEKIRSAITIFLMNIPHFITAGVIFTSLVSPQGISWFDINFIFVPILTSTLNPLLIVGRGTAIQRMIRNKIRGVVKGKDQSLSSRGYSGKTGQTGSTIIKNTTSAA